MFHKIQFHFLKASKNCTSKALMMIFYSIWFSSLLRLIWDLSRESMHSFFDLIFRKSFTVGIVEWLLMAFIEVSPSLPVSSLSLSRETRKPFYQHQQTKSRSSSAAFVLQVRCARRRRLKKPSKEVRRRRAQRRLWNWHRNTHKHIYTYIVLRPIDLLEKQSVKSRYLVIR